MLFALPLLLAAGLPFADDQDGERPWPGPYIENDELLVGLRQHAPEQIAAFYEARGFPQAAIDIIRQTCFVTVHIENRSRKVIWLDTARWTFNSEGRPLQRLDRDGGQNHWDRIDLRQASRSTFGWTQLPAVRDLQPDEPVGGNLVFPGSTRRFSMTLDMPTGADREGEPVILEFPSVECPKEVKAK